MKLSSSSCDKIWVSSHKQHNLSQEINILEFRVPALYAGSGFHHSKPSNIDSLVCPDGVETDCIVIALIQF